MEDDKEPLSGDRASSGNVVAQTRAKFDQLLDEALSKNKKGKKGGKLKKLPFHKKKKGKDTQDEILETKLDIGEEEEEPAPPRAPPRGILQPLQRPGSSAGSLKRVQVVDSKAISPGRRSSSKEMRKPATVEEAPSAELSSDNDDLAKLQAPVPQPRPRSAKGKRGDSRRSSAASSRRSSRSRSRSSLRDEKIEMRSLASEAVADTQMAPEENIEGNLSVMVHECRLPGGHRAPRSLRVRVHLVDGEMAAEMKTEEGQVLGPRTTKPSTEIKGGVAQICQRVIFPAPLESAHEEHAVLLMELSVPSTASCYTRPAGEGDRCIGWCFLKLQGGVNCGPRLRLQVYEPLHPPFRKVAVTNNCKAVLGWWRRGPWRKSVASTLQVTVEAAPGSPKSSSRHSSGVVRRNGEEGGEDTKDCVSGEEGASEKLAGAPELGEWIRRPVTQLCHPPAPRTRLSLPSGTANCLTLAFSPDGTKLACAGIKHQILVFKVPEFTQITSFKGHQGIVYDLTWLQEDRLLSTSADCTVIQWQLQRRTAEVVVPHPTFVYCCRVVSSETAHVELVTGSRDGIVRIWKQRREGTDFDLWQELEGHAGFVTSLCNLVKVPQLASADSEGGLLIWGRNSQDWSLLRRLEVAGLQGLPVTSIVAHPEGSRLIVHARDSVVRSVDLSLGVVVTTYRGALSHKSRTGLCVSPCGTLVLAGSEDGATLIWRAETGVLLAQLPPPTSPCPPAAALAHHPRGHLVVTTFFGHPPSPAVIWTHDAKDSGEIPSSSLQESLTRTQGGLQEDSLLLEGLRTQEGGVRLHDIIARIDRVLGFTNALQQR